MDVIKMTLHHQIVMDITANRIVMDTKIMFCTETGSPESSNMTLT
jgi:cytoskeletal protein CcmA (bactofilin family)